MISVMRQLANILLAWKYKLERRFTFGYCENKISISTVPHSTVQYGRECKLEHNIVVLTLQTKTIQPQNKPLRYSNEYTKIELPNNSKQSGRDCPENRVVYATEYS